MTPEAGLFVVCKKCGSEVSPYVTECPYCGTRLRKRAPKLDRPERSHSLRASRLSPLRPGEIPGIRADARPWATAALVLGALALTLAWRAGAVGFEDVVVFGRPGAQWWRVFTAPFIYDSVGYGAIALTAIGLFGWLLERRHGPAIVLLLFVCAASTGMLLATVQPAVLASGGNGGALGLLAAWSVPDLIARRSGEETDSDLLGVAAIAGCVLLTPLVAADADWLAGIGGGLVGLALGVPLARIRRAAA
jgi:membrane associated rhomboid family serine protease